MHVTLGHKMYDNIGSQVANQLANYNCTAGLYIKTQMVNHKAKEKAESGTPETHAHEYFIGTRALTIKNDITKEP